MSILRAALTIYRHVFVYYVFSQRKSNLFTCFFYWIWLAAFIRVVMESYYYYKKVLKPNILYILGHLWEMSVLIHFIYWDVLTCKKTWCIEKPEKNVLLHVLSNTIQILIYLGCYARNTYTFDYFFLCHATRLTIVISNVAICYTKWLFEASFLEWGVHQCISFRFAPAFFDLHHCASTLFLSTCQPQTWLLTILAI